MTFLILGASNHCVFEELFVYLQKTVLNLEVHDHLPNHPGATSSHKHENSSESHQHGQPHAVFALTSGKTVVSNSYFLLICIPIVSIFLLQTLTKSQTSRKIFYFATDDPARYLKRALSSLTSAPQAPPAILFSAS